MSIEENKALVRRYLDEALNKGNLAVIDEVLDPGYYPPLEDGIAPGGIERYKQGVARTRAALPDLQVTFDYLIGEGDLVAYQTTWRGTHLGPYRGIPPTGRRVEWRVTCFRRVVDGRVVAGSGSYDYLGLLEQLGASVRPPDRADIG